MRYGQIREVDVANGEGIRVSFFVTGCHLRCKGCFNKAYQDFSFGEIWTEEETNRVIRALDKFYIKGLTVLGGEPFQNTEELYPILQKLKKVLREDQDLWIYSGYTFEELRQNEKNRKMLALCDVLVDGPFELHLKDLRLAYRGSSNQRIIQVPKSLEKEKAVLYELTNF